MQLEMYVYTVYTSNTGTSGDEEIVLLEKCPHFRG